MPTLQTEYITILGALTRLFAKRTWEHAKIRLPGAILSPAERTVTAILRVIGLLWQLRQLKNSICMITRFRMVRLDKV